MYFYQILQDDTVATLFSYYFFQAATTSDKFLPVCGGLLARKTKYIHVNLDILDTDGGRFLTPKCIKRLEKSWRH